MTRGIEPLLRHPSAAADSALLVMLTAIMVAGLLCMPTLTRIATNFLRGLFRSHREAMPGEKTLGERLVVIVAITQALVFEALMLYCCLGAKTMPPLASTAGLMLLTLGLFCYQFAGYTLTGYAFTTPENSRIRQSAFMLTLAMSGPLLVIPAMGALFYPDLLGLFVTLGAIVYVACRIPLFINEFRFFYTTPASLFYFFLYLCALEIVPLAAVWTLADTMSSLFC